MKKFVQGESHDEESFIRRRVPFEKLPGDVRQTFQSQHEYNQRVKEFCFQKRLSYDDHGLQLFFKTCEEYYKGLMNYLQKHLMLYPYKFSSFLINKLNIEPFNYYMVILMEIMKNEKSYDILPNFTASDAQRLVGVSRNEYIEIINKARSKKFMWRINKGSILTGLLPKTCQDNLIIGYWWEVEAVDIPQNEFLRQHVPNLSEEEKLTIGCIKARGRVMCGQVDQKSCLELYKKNLVYFHVPVDPKDYILVPTLKNFIMNRKPTDYFEKIVYDILVTMDERTSIEEIASILDVDQETVCEAVSLCCRCNFGLKKLPRPSEEVGLHSSWLEDVEMYHKELEKKGLISSISQEFLSNPDGKSKKKRRIGFIFDNSLTAHLMFGNLGQEIKRHAVTLFEIGKLTDEQMDDFLVQLDTVDAPDREIGEARVYYNFAISIRQTLRFLRKNEQLKETFDKTVFDGGLDLVRCESLEHLDSQTKLKILKTNYSLIVAQAPLKSKTTSLPMCIDSFYGPPLLLLNTVWGKMFLYSRASVGPITLLLRKGHRVAKLQDKFCNSKRVMFCNWEMDPSIIKSNVVLQTLNDSLSQNPVMIQALDDNFDNSMTNTKKIVFPFEEADYEEEIPEKERRIISDIVSIVEKNMYLENSFGVLTFLKVVKKEFVDYLPLELSFGIPLEDDRLNKKLWNVLHKRRLLSKESLDRHNVNMKNLAKDFIQFLDNKLAYKIKLDETHVLPTRSLCFNGKNIEIIE